MSFFIGDLLFLPESHSLFFIGDPLFLLETHWLFLLNTPWFRRKPLIFIGNPFFHQGSIVFMRYLLFFNWIRSPLVFSNEKMFIKIGLYLRNKKQLKKKTLMDIFECGLINPDQVKTFVKVIKYFQNFCNLL